MIALVVVATDIVLIVKLAVFAPEGTVITAGTVADPILEVKLIDVPEDGAGASNETVPVEFAPPKTDTGDNVNPARAADGVTVIAAVTDVTP